MIAKLMLNLYKSGHCSNYLHLYLHSFQYITWQFILQLYQLLHERTRVSFHALSNSSYICIATSKGKRPRNERIEIFYDSGGRTIARFPLLLSVWNSRKKPRKWRVKRSSPHGIFAKRCLHYVYCRSLGGRVLGITSFLSAFATAAFLPSGYARRCSRLYDKRIYLLPFEFSILLFQRQTDEKKPYFPFYSYSSLFL